MKFYHGTGSRMLRNTQQTRTQWGVGLTPHLECARNFGHIVLVIEVAQEKVSRQTVADHPDRHWSDRDAMVADAADCRIIKKIGEKGERK